jgi:hypothetical protein
MMESTPSLRERVDAILSSLPAGVVTGHHEHLRLVVSTGGVFVLDPAGSDSGHDPGLAERQASLTRASMAERLRWVPFVDWFVVTEDETTDSRLPADLVEVTMLEGRSVDEPTVRRIQALLELGELDPPWQTGLPSRQHPADLARAEAESERPAV